MHWYVDVLSKYATFTGRARRKEYWMFALMNFLVLIGLVLISRLSPMLVMILPLYQLGTLLPNISVGVRRMHDTGRSGWWLLCPLVPLVFLVLEGQPAANTYGPNPKEAQS